METLHPCTLCCCQRQSLTHLMLVSTGCSFTDLESPPSYLTAQKLLQKQPQAQPPPTPLPIAATPVPLYTHCLARQHVHASPPQPRPAKPAPLPFSAIPRFYPYQEPPLTCSRDHRSLLSIRSPSSRPFSPFPHSDLSLLRLPSLRLNFVHLTKSLHAVLLSQQYYAEEHVSPNLHGLF